MIYILNSLHLSPSSLDFTLKSPTSAHLVEEGAYVMLPETSVSATGVWRWWWCCLLSHHCHQMLHLPGLPQSEISQSPIQVRFLTLKVPITTSADDMFNFFFFIDNKSWYFMWITCQADDSHEMSRLIFNEKKKKKKKKWKCPLLQNFAWRFKS